MYTNFKKHDSFAICRAKPADIKVKITISSTFKLKRKMYKNTKIFTH